MNFWLSFEGGLILINSVLRKHNIAYIRLYMWAAEVDLSSSRNYHWQFSALVSLWRDVLVFPLAGTRLTSLEQRACWEGFSYVYNTEKLSSGSHFLSVLTEVTALTCLRF